ncbi:FAD binding domain-containing protein [Desulfobacula sp.]
MADMNYIRPDDLDQALDFLSHHGPETEILAGGTDVMVDLRAGELDRKKNLLDISRLEELQQIDFKDGKLSIGSGVTLTRINGSDLIRQNAPALIKCSNTFAGKQVRNKATIGGNIAHASPCGDTIPPLVIHDAKALVVTKTQKKLIPVETIASGPYRSSLPSDAVIVKFILTPCEAQFADFQKIGRRKELAVSRMSLAVMADKDKNGLISFIRIGLGACTPTPHRMDAVEEFLINKLPTQQVIWDAGKLLSQRMIGITGRRSSIIYKEPAIQGLFIRILYPMVQS